MLFRFSHGLANFQSYINKILAEKLNVFIIMYLDNILVYTKESSQSHMEAVR